MLFSLQLIVCRYVTLVDFYVPIQFNSFFPQYLLHKSNVFFIRIFCILVHILHHFTAAKRFLCRLHEGIFASSFTAARTASISRTTSSLEVMSAINGADGNAPFVEMYYFGVCKIALKFISILENRYPFMHKIVCCCCSSFRCFVPKACISLFVAEYLFWLLCEMGKILCLSIWLWFRIVFCVA